MAASATIDLKRFAIAVVVYLAIVLIAGYAIARVVSNYEVAQGTAVPTIASGAEIALIASSLLTIYIAFYLSLRAYGITTINPWRFLAGGILVPVIPGIVQLVYAFLSSYLISAGTLSLYEASQQILRVILIVIVFYPVLKYVKASEKKK